jgi:hypothetical protein
MATDDDIRRALAHVRTGGNKTIDNTRTIEEQIQKQQLLIRNLRNKITDHSHSKDADYAVKLHAMLSHALAGLAALCYPVGADRSTTNDNTGAP